MDLAERVARRRSARRAAGVMVERDVLSPVTHRPEPVGRGVVLEELLDAVDPVFDGDLPPDVAVAGPHGSGTSAVVTALFASLNDRLGAPDRSIATTTRGGAPDPVTWFLTVDARTVASPFAFYRAVLSALVDGGVPDGGVETDVLRNRLAGRLDRPDRRAVVAIDHHDEPGGLDLETVRGLLAPFEERVALVPVGRTVPEDWSGPVVRVSPYRRHELVDVVTDRATTGLATGAVDHGTLRELAAWADGNAHDALAALFGAATLAARADADRIADDHLDRAMADVPADGIHVARPLSVSESRQRVLAGLVELDAPARSIGDLATEIAARTDVASGTVTRFLYELAGAGILRRVALPADGSGRRPSTVEPRFPTIVFRTHA
ncbi:AAA family ATPase, partial [Halovivax sp.]|uniref:AAA family ATPase n=1 Tax=Halovivax sp. TaxID=1935978 RepID=UPI0025C6F308